MVLIEVPLGSLRGPFSQSRKPYGHVLKASLSIIPTRHLDERAQDLLDDPLSLMVVSCKDLCPHLDAALTEATGTYRSQAPQGLHPQALQDRKPRMTTACIALFASTLLCRRLVDEERSYRKIDRLDYQRVRESHVGLIDERRQSGNRGAARLGDFG